MAAQQNEQGESHVERAASPFRPYDEAGGQRCAVGFVGHVEIGPPRVPKADSFVQYTFTVRTEVSGTLEFTDRFSTMHMRHQQLKQQGVLEHYAPPLVFPSKGAVMPWWPGADKRIVERGEQLADYYQRLVCEATLETLEALGTCWAPGYTLHEVAPSRDAAEPEGSHEVSAVASHLEEGGSTGVAQGSAERQGQVDAADIDALPPAPEDLPQTNAAAWWTVLLVLLVAIVIGGAATLGPTIIGTTTDKHALPIGRVPSRGQLDDMRTNLRAAEASRVDPTRADEIDAAAAAAAAAAAEVERAQQLKARLEMRRAKLTAAEEDQRTLQEAERKRKKQRAAYEASVVRRHDTGQPHTRLQQDLGPYSVETKTSSLQTILTKHGCTCLPTTIDRADPSAPVEWDGCASRTSDSFACICGSL